MEGDISTCKKKCLHLYQIICIFFYWEDNQWRCIVERTNSLGETIKVFRWKSEGGDYTTSQKVIHFFSKGDGWQAINDICGV